MNTKIEEKYLCQKCKKSYAHCNCKKEEPKTELKVGMKYDADKPKMEYLSAQWIEGVSRVLAFGAKKYEGHNWRKGITQSRLLGAALRHIFSYLRGEDLDPETGLSHLHHASCCLMFASELKETHPHLDDRYKVGAPSLEKGRAVE